MSQPAKLNAADRTCARTCAIVLTLLAATTLARAQVVVDTNDIIGDVRFTNANPAILTLLNGPSIDPMGQDEGINAIETKALSTAPPGLIAQSNQVSLGEPDRLGKGYTLPVQAGNPAIVYDVSAEVWLDTNANNYRFTSVSGIAVDLLPAPPVQVDFHECVAMVRVEWVDATGAPVAVCDGDIWAQRELSPGSGTYENHYTAQARADIGAVSVEYIAVRGDNTNYQIEIFFDFGLDPFHDTIRLFEQRFITAACDQIIPIVIVLGGDPGGNLGRIVGRVDILGEDEHALSTTIFNHASTRVTASSGPFGNLRVDALPSTPSSGFFELENLVPSAIVTPPQPYTVDAFMRLRTGRDYQEFSPPLLRDGVNAPVLVAAGQTVDLGDTFVIDPGFLAGDILLVGPPSNQSAGLADLYRSSDDDSNGDGIPNDLRASASSHLAAAGLNTVPPGATFHTEGGLSFTLFQGDYNPVQDSFVGAYEQVLGGLNHGSGYWKSILFEVELFDRATPQLPETYQFMRAVIRDRIPPTFLIQPGQTVIYPRHFCFSQLNVTYRSNSGPFFAPQLTGLGTFTGLDFESVSQDYNVELAIPYSAAVSMGTPVDAANAADVGLVSVGLPEGSYTLDPFIQRLAVDGSTSRTQLHPFAVAVGCRQVIDVSTELQMSIDSLPVCSDSAGVTVAGSVAGTEPIARIEYNLNAGAAVTICAPCGVAPTFSTTVTLQPGDNQIEVTATGEDGDQTSVTSVVRFDVAPPQLSGCDDHHVTVAAGATGANVDYQVTAVDGVGDPLPVTCVPPSGSFFPIGTTPVVCTTSSDLCGESANCNFEVIVDQLDDCEPGPVVTVVLEPLPTAPASSAVSGASSGCVPPTAATFQLVCTASDGSDPNPEIDAVLVITHNDVIPPGVCDSWVEEIPIQCGDVITIELLAPVCVTDPRPPSSASSASSVGVIAGQAIHVVVTATDDCGNVTTITLDPSVCTPTDGGSCCPVIGPPPSPDCEVCGGLGLDGGHSSRADGQAVNSASSAIKATRQRR